MIRYDCLKILAPMITDQLVVTSQSGQRIEWAHLKPEHPGNLLVGEMGAALGVGIGLALALPRRKVLVFESDGSVLLTLSILATLGNLKPPNLAAFVFDNQSYSGTRISEPTATAASADLEAIARGAGVARTATVRDLEAFKEAGPAALRQSATSFTVCKVEESLVHRDIPRPDVDLVENKYRFVRYLEETEGRPNPFIGRG